MSPYQGNLFLKTEFQFILVLGVSDKWHRSTLSQWQRGKLMANIYKYTKLLIEGHINIKCFLTQPWDV